MKMIYFDNYSNFELAIKNHKQIVKRVVFIKTRSNHFFFRADFFKYSLIMLDLSLYSF